MAQSTKTPMKFRIIERIAKLFRYTTMTYLDIDMGGRVWIFRKEAR